MNAVSRARLKAGKRIGWQGRTFTYCGFKYRAHILKEENVSQMVEYPTGAVHARPIYEYLSNEEIMDAEVMKG
jgi:hypothetical protein